MSNDYIIFTSQVGNNKRSRSPKPPTLHNVNKALTKKSSTSTRHKFVKIAIYPNNFELDTTTEITFTIQINGKFNADINLDWTFIECTPTLKKQIEEQLKPISLQPLNPSTVVTLNLHIEETQRTSACFEIALSNKYYNLDARLIAKSSKLQFYSKGLPFRTIYETQEKIATKLKQKCTALLKDTNYESIDFLVYVPNMISLYNQTLERLGDPCNILNASMPQRINWERKISRVLQVALPHKIGRTLNDHLLLVEGNSKTLFVVVHDECHLSPKGNSQVSKHLLQLLQFPNTLYIGISATAENQVKALVKQNPKLHEQVVIWNTGPNSNYYGRQQYNDNRDTMITVAKSPSFITATNRTQKLIKDYISGVQSNHCEIEGTKLVLRKLQDVNNPGLVVVKLQGSSKAKSFAMQMSNALRKENKGYIFVCVDVSTMASAQKITCYSHEAVKFESYQELQGKNALLIIVNKGSVGDTFPTPFVAYDIRARYEKVNNWASFEQACGRAYGYVLPSNGYDSSSRPHLLLCKEAAEVFEVGPTSSKIVQLGTSLVRNKKSQPINLEGFEQVPAYHLLISTCMSVEEYFNCASICAHESLDLHSFLMKYGIQKLKMKNPSKLHNASKPEDLLNQLSKYYDIVIKRNGTYLMQPSNTKKDVIGFCMLNNSFLLPVHLEDEPLSDCIHSFTEDSALWTLSTYSSLIKDHDLNDEHAGMQAAANTVADGSVDSSLFLQTFSKRVFLVAKPQIGKTGAIISLLYKLSFEQKLPIRIDSNSCKFPQSFMALTQKLPIDHNVRVSCIKFKRGKYGTLSLCWDLENACTNLPTYHALEAVKKKRRYLISRIDWNNNKTKPLQTNQHMQHRLDSLTQVKLSTTIVRVKYSSSSNSNCSPIVIISKNRIEGETMQIFNRVSMSRQVFLIVNQQNYEAYSNKYTSFNIVVIQEKEDGVSFYRNVALELAIKENWSWIWLLDDNIRHWLVSPTLNVNRGVMEGANSDENARNIIDLFDDANFASTKSKFTLLSLRRYSPNVKVSNLFSTQMAKCAMHINIEHIKKYSIDFDTNFQYGEDMLFFFDCWHFKTGGICRFNYCLFSKNEGATGGCRSLTSTAITNEELDAMTLNETLNCVLPRIDEALYTNRKGLLLPKVACVSPTSKNLNMQLQHKITRFIEHSTYRTFNASNYAAVLLYCTSLDDLETFPTNQLPQSTVNSFFNAHSSCLQDSVSWKDVKNDILQQVEQDDDVRKRKLIFLRLVEVCQKLAISVDLVKNLTSRELYQQITISCKEVEECKHKLNSLNILDFQYRISKLADYSISAKELPENSKEREELFSKFIENRGWFVVCTIAVCKSVSSILQSHFNTVYVIKRSLKKVLFGCIDK